MWICLVWVWPLIGVGKCQEKMYFLKNVYFKLCVHICVYAFLCQCEVGAWEVRIGCWIPQCWRYVWVWAAWCGCWDLSASSGTCASSPEPSLQRQEMHFLNQWAYSSRTPKLLICGKFEVCFVVLCGITLEIQHFSNIWRIVADFTPSGESFWLVMYFL